MSKTVDEIWVDAHTTKLNEFYTLDPTKMPVTVKAELLELVLEIIGEDEVPTIPINDYYWRIRNEYRQKLREKVRKYCD